MKKIVINLFILSLAVLSSISTARANEKQRIKAIGVPLADHYAAIIAFEKYRGEMKYADFRFMLLSGPDLVRAYFQSEDDADMAFNTCPIAMDMFLEKQNFRLVSLLHRDGNALAINDLLNASVNLPKERMDRKPDYKVAEALTRFKNDSGNPIECGVPSLLSTHTVILYKYLSDHGIRMNFGVGTDKEVLVTVVSPPKSLTFIRKKNSRNIPALFEQSLPWADVVETQQFGHVAWYSKDVMPWPKGHVECIAIAKDKCIKEKTKALKEVIYYIHRAGLDIEEARRKGGDKIIEISDMIRKHIPEHNQDAIIQCLRPDLNVINYFNLNVDKDGLRQIMNYAVEGRILKKPVDIDALADTRFSTKITERKIDKQLVNE